jgi:hypothetical protein
MRVEDPILSMVAEWRNSVKRSGVRALKAFHWDRNSSSSATKRSISGLMKGSIGVFSGIISITVSILIHLSNSLPGQRFKMVLICDVLKMMAV